MPFFIFIFFFTDLVTHNVVALGDFMWEQGATVLDAF